MEPYLGKLYNKISKKIIKPLLYLIIAFFYSCSSDITSNDLSEMVLNHDSPYISYSGRMVDSGDGLLSGWTFYNKIPCRFALQNADTLKMFFDVALINAYTKACIEIFVDSVKFKYELTSQNYGVFKAFIPITNRDYHRIRFTMYMEENSLNECFNLIDVIKFNKAEINRGNFTLDHSIISLPKIAYIGDSWGFLIPENINANKYNVYPISAAGGTALSYLPYYPYAFQQTAFTDPNFDAIIFNFGVNEFNANFTENQVYSSFLALLNRIRVNQPTAKIIIVNKPNNTLADRDYGKYRNVMRELSVQLENTYFLDSDSMNMNDSMWGDLWHPNSLGYARYAKYIEHFIDKLMIARL